LSSTTVVHSVPNLVARILDLPMTPQSAMPIPSTATFRRLSSAGISMSDIPRVLLMSTGMEFPDLKSFRQSADNAHYGAHKWCKSLRTPGISNIFGLQELTAPWLAGQGKCQFPGANNIDNSEMLVILSDSNQSRDPVNPVSMAVPVIKMDLFRFDNGLAMNADFHFSMPNPLNVSCPLKAIHARGTYHKRFFPQPKRQACRAYQSG
jgi:hypothetical protein